MTLLPVGSNIIIMNLMFALKYHFCFIFPYLSSFTELIFKPNTRPHAPFNILHPLLKKSFSCKLNFNHYSVEKNSISYLW